MIIVLAGRLVLFSSLDIQIVIIYGTLIKTFYKKRSLILHLTITLITLKISKQIFLALKPSLDTITLKGNPLLFSGLFYIAIILVELGIGFFYASLDNAGVNIRKSQRHL